MNFDKRIRFIRLNDQREIEYLDITPNQLKGWNLLSDDTTMPPTVWVDEAVPWLKPEEK